MRTILGAVAGLVVCLCADGSGAPLKPPKTPDEYIRRFQHETLNSNYAEETLLRKDPGPSCLGDQEIPTLERMTRSPLEEIRIWACRALGERKATSALDTLVERLRDKERNVRYAAAASLGLMGDTRAVPHLLALLAADAMAGPTAAKALGALGDRRAVPALVQCLSEQYDRRRAAAALALAAIGDKAAADPLLTALTDPEPVVRRAVIEALGVLKEPRAVEAILRALDEPDREGRRKSAEALGRIGDRTALPALQRALVEDEDSGVRANAADALGALGDAAAVPALATVLQQERLLSVKIRVAKALHTLGDKRGMAALLASIRSHAYATTSTRHPGRDAIIELGTDALPIILPLLGEGTSDHAPPSKYIIEILTAMGKPVVNPLLKVLRSGKLVERRRAAIILGYRLQEPRAIVPLANLVVKSPTLRPVAAGALAGIGRPATPAILKLFKVRDASVRAAMLGAAGKSTDPALVAPLLKMLSSRTPSVRVDVFRALVNKKDPRVRAALVKHLQDPDAYVRREAARYLGYYGAREDIQALQRQLAREKDASVQRILLQAVVRLRDS